MSVILEIGKGIKCIDLPKAAKQKIRNDLCFDNPDYIAAMKQGRYIAADCPSHIHLYCAEGNVYWIPRGYIYYLRKWLRLNKYLVQIKDFTLLLKPLNLKFNGKLRPYQEKAKQDVVSYPVGVLEAATGSGKTVMAISIIVHRQQPTLIIVHSKELLYQWRDAIKQFIGVDCGLIGDGKFKIKPITVGIINTVKKNVPRLAKRYGHIICDECVVPDTEILTDEGWKLIKDLNKTEKVAQWNDKEEISFVHPIKYIQKEFKGELINFKSREMDLLATPEHQQPYRSISNKTNNITQCKDAIKNIKIGNPHIEFPLNGKNKGILKFNTFYRFVIMTQADGSLCKYKNRIDFAFTKKRKIKRFLKIVKILKYKYKKVNSKRKNYSRYMVWPNKKVTKIFQTEINIKDVNEGFVDNFINELTRWDGSRKDNRLYYSTTDKNNADWIQSLCVLGGWKCSRSIQIDNRKKTYNDVHRFYFYKNNYQTSQSIKKTKVIYDGKVYCVRVPFGNIIIRRNNKVMITGNCHRIAASTWSETIQDFPAKHYLGLTATPFRRDGLGHAIFACIGPKRHKVDKNMLFKTKAVLRPDVYKIVSDFRYIFANDYSTMISSLTNDISRNRLITSLIVEDLEHYNENVLIVSDRKKHLLNMQETLLNEHRVKSLVLTGSVNKKERAEVISKVKSGKCKVLFATLSLIGEGFDAPDLTTLILTTPVKFSGRLIQACGRVLRPKKGKTPRIYDIRDPEVAVLRYSGFNRDKIYVREWGGK